MCDRLAINNAITAHMCTLITVLATGSATLAVPIAPQARTLTQPDGVTFSVLPGGDEWFNWASHDGALVVQNAYGWWCYAELRSGVLRPTAARVGIDPPPRDAALTDELSALAQTIARPAAAQAPQPPRTTRSGTRPVLVVLVEFTDYGLSTPDAYWHDLFFGTSGKTVQSYYHEISGGGLTLVPASETAGTADDGIVRVQLSSSDHNNGQHPNPHGVIDNSNRWIVYDALQASDLWVQYGAFDSNPADGDITSSELHIVTVVAGYEHGFAGPSTPTPAVHAHRWVLGSTWNSVYVPPATCDGCSLGDWSVGGGYVQIGEWHTDHAATIGVPCHELGHDMGLPDLYDVLLTSDGIGAHGVMGYGCWGQTATDSYLAQTPVHMCAWSKDQVGFVTPTLASGNQDYSLMSTDRTDYNVVRVNTADPNQYFLIENRQLQGFDEGLYHWFSVTSGGTGGGGLAVWHVDEAAADNNNPLHKRVDLEEANEGLLGWSELDYRPPYPQDPVPYQGNRDHYYYAGHVTDFGDGTTPNSKLYNGGTTYLNVSSVSTAGPIMKCYVATLHGNQQQTEWATYMGGWRNDIATSVAIGPNGDIYLAGNTNSPDFPTTPGAYDTALQGYGGIFVSILSSSGALRYSTFLDSPGSSYAPSAIALAVDSAGCAYVTGKAYESMPTTPGALDMSYNGGYAGSTYGDVFVAKFDATLSSLDYCTYIGGADSDSGWSIAVDGAGSAYITGQTFSSNFPCTLGSYGSSADLFIAKLNTAGSALVYSRVFNTTSSVGYGITIDTAGNAYVTGYTWDSTFPTTPGAYDTTFNNSPGYPDSFLTRLGTNGSIDYSTFLGPAFGWRADVALDTAGYAYVTGTGMAGYPTTPGVFEPTGTGLYVTKLYPADYNGIEWSTFLSADHDPTAIEVDGANNAFVAGYFGVGGQENNEAFVAGFDPDGTSLVLYQEYMGSDRDEAMDVAVDYSGTVYLSGSTYSADFPVTPGALDPTLGGTTDGFLAKIAWNQVTTSLVVGVPDGSEAWFIDQTQPIRWSSSGAGGTVNIELSRNGYNGPWESLFAGTPNDGSEDWVVTGPQSANCVIRITAGYGSLTDISNAPFAISPFITGDLDCTGGVDFDDINPFVVALSGEAAYNAAYPNCEWLNADCDGDGDVDFDDINAFIALLGS